jgi:hypothetical protein
VAPISYELGKVDGYESSSVSKLKELCRYVTVFAIFRLVRKLAKSDY